MLFVIGNHALKSMLGHDEKSLILKDKANHQMTMSSKVVKEIELQISMGRNILSAFILSNDIMIVHRNFTMQQSFVVCCGLTKIIVFFFFFFLMGD